MHKICLLCKRSFKTSHGGTKYCSVGCFGLASRLENNPRWVGRKKSTCPACFKEFSYYGRNDPSYKKRFCTLKCSKKFQHKTPEQKREAKRAWYKKNRVKALEGIRRSYRKYRTKRIRDAVEKRNVDKREARKLALKKYGGSPPKCACCGEKEYRFLCIDHVDGGGNAHRMLLSRTTRLGLMGWLVQTRKKPKQYQVLCYNCNMGKEGEDKICPHQKKK